ncbi:Polyubiquitin (Fragment) [Seminavis robusta]|uniref:Polyubiquitin n=1 Tax=Seminavis robusta TaxID=568900 RepID=A0A9N8H8D8_9STRA
MALNAGSTPDLGQGAAATTAEAKQTRLKLGRCPSCGTQTHKLRMFRSAKPLTIEGKVENGRCLSAMCLGEENNDNKEIDVDDLVDDDGVEFDPDDFVVDFAGSVATTATATTAMTDNQPWHCAACTFLNKSVHSHCEVCNTPKPTKPVRVSVISPTKPPSIQETMDHVNATLQSLGGTYADYACRMVSWDDASRNTTATGALSSWGTNITDTYLKAKDGRKLFTVRPDNWNEKLGLVTTDEVAVVVRDATAGAGKLRPVTLRDVLHNMGGYGKACKMDADTNLHYPELDKEVSIRFQTTFIPVDSNNQGRNNNRENIEFGIESYNYNTLDDAKPKNLLLLCTSQGMAIQADGKGPQLLLHHFVPPHQQQSIARHWFEAERSDHKVGGSQWETDQERADAAQRGKATAAVIGTQAMGTRFNALMTIQVPLSWEMISIQISTSTGRTIKLNVKPTDTILSVKKKLHNKLCDEPSRQKLDYRGLELKDDQTIKACNIKNTSTLILSSASSGTQTITVKTLTGKKITVDKVNPSVDTIDSIMDRIHEIEKIPPKQQRLMFSGKHLEKGSTLSSHGVKGGSELHLLRGALARDPSERATSAPTRMGVGSSTRSSSQDAPIQIPLVTDEDEADEDEAQDAAMDMMGLNRQTSVLAVPAAPQGLFWSETMILMKGEGVQDLPTAVATTSTAPTLSTLTESVRSAPSLPAPISRRSSDGTPGAVSRPAAISDGSRRRSSDGPAGLRSSAPAAMAAAGMDSSSRRYDEEDSIAEANAARVSIGSKYDDWHGLRNGKGLGRHESERVTVTIVLYNVVAGGVPAENDIVAAVEDMEALYLSCSGGYAKLASENFDSFKNGGLPPVVEDYNVFPTSAIEPQSIEDAKPQSIGDTKPPAVTTKPPAVTEPSALAKAPSAATTAPNNPPQETAPAPKGPLPATPAAAREEPMPPFVRKNTKDPDARVLNDGPVDRRRGIDP